MLHGKGQGLAISLAFAALIASTLPSAHCQPVVGTKGTSLSDVTHVTKFNASTEHIVALQVITPFVMYDKTKTGNEAFTGFTIDVFKKLETELNLKFKFILGDTEDMESANKALEHVGAFAGVGALLKSDVAAGALHITANRSRAVNFAFPYYTLGYSLVVRAPIPVTDPFTFLMPFDVLLWVGIFVECVIVALCFLLLESPLLLGAEETDLTGDSKVANGLDALYFSLSALTCTLDKGPKSWGGKIVMLGHGWFMLIIISAYTANLASFLTIQGQVTTVSSFTELAQSAGQYKLCIPKGQSHETFINYEKGHYGYKFDITYSKTWEECMQMVADGKVDATFEDQPVVEYYLANTVSGTPLDCKLSVVGSPFNPVGYGFAFSSDSTHFLPYTQAIIHLQELGEMTKLSKEWGIGPYAAGSSCSTASDSGQFYIDEMWGLIGVTAVIIVLGLLASLALKVTTKGEGAVSPEGGETGTAGRGGGDMEYAIRAGIEAGIKEAMRIQAEQAANGAVRATAATPNSTDKMIAEVDGPPGN